MSAHRNRNTLTVLHIGAGRYVPDDNTHSTYDIWRQVSKGFRNYTVVGRSTKARYYKCRDGNLDIRLLPSVIESEAEFLVSQFLASSIGVQLQPDVVVSQCPVQGGLVASKIKKHCGAKVLMEFHMGHYFETKPAISKNGLLESLTERNLHCADRIRVLSSGMRTGLLNRFGRQYEDKVVVLPPRVDLSRFAIVKRDWQISRRLKIVIVGSVNERKGQLRFLTSVLPNTQEVEIWIVGTGPDIPACKAYVSRSGAEDRVVFWGHKNHVELAELLPKADAMVLYSRMEGTPRAIMEGMAVGLPIITTNAGYCADIVESGREGFVLSENPDDEVVSRLTQLVQDDSLRTRMGQAAHERATREFDSVVLYEKYRSLIAETASV